MLSPYRVLDLTDEKGLLCGKLLGDLGADVIKIERSGGDSARMIGPFYHDEVDPEKSLLWWAYNTGKRSITLDIESPAGKETLKKLVKTADLVIESFPPGHLDRLGLGYPTLREVNPGLVMVSITPFGQSGPYRDYKGPDIILWALGGQMQPCGEPDRPPVRMSHHSQAYLHAAAEAASAAMMALYDRNRIGHGQYVDVSIHEVLAQSTYLLAATWDMMKVVRHRGGVSSVNPIRITRVWPCKDGHVFWLFFGGAVARRWNLPLIRWMGDEGTVDDYLKNFDWDSFDFATTTQQIVDAINARAKSFFMTHTKAELMEGALKYHAMIYPVFTAKDILENPQLIQRQFWVNLEYPGSSSVRYPGPFVKFSRTPVKGFCRSPLIGEHNQEVFEELTRYAEAHPSLSGAGVGNIPAQNTNSPRRRLLEGINILDFTWNAAAPITIKTMCDHGANVIKVEGRTKPDFQRTLAAFKDAVPGLNRSGDWNRWNTGKLSLALNLTHPKAIGITKKLAAWADIVAENFSGGVMERMGLGYEELRKIKPDIIMLSSCIQGQTGPHATLPGFGNHLTAISGFIEITGWPDREPTPPEGPYTDFIAPRFTLLALMAALDYRRRTGQGQYLDISQYETAMHFIAPLLLDYQVNGRVASRTGNHHPLAAPHNAYCCRGDDRWCAIAVFTDEEWQSFRKAIGGPDWSRDQRFANLQSRQQNEDELDRLIGEWTINHSAEDVMTLLQQAGVPAGLLENGQDLLEKDPQLMHRHSFWWLDHPEVGKHHATGPSFIMSDCSYEVKRAPLLGEHNEFVLKEVLRMSDDEIADLVIEGVVE